MEPGGSAESELVERGEALPELLRLAGVLAQEQALGLELAEAASAASK